MIYSLTDSLGNRWQTQMVETAASGLVSARVVWDDECSDFDYKSRTQQSGWAGPDNPPAVYRYYPPDPETGGAPKQDKPGDFRVNMESPYNWRPSMITVNDGDVRKFNYVIQTGLALYNTGGWPQQAYLTMSGNYLLGEVVGNWFKFITLKQSDAARAATMTNATHRHYVQNFTCVTWDRVNKTTRRIESTGTQHGKVYFFLVTVEGFGFIPLRHVKL